MYFGILLITAVSVVASSHTPDRRQASCASGNLYQGQYCCPGTFIYYQEQGEAICCVGDPAEGYYFNAGPSACSTGTATPVTSFDSSGNLVSGDATSTAVTDDSSSTADVSSTSSQGSPSPLTSTTSGQSSTTTPPAEVGASSASITSSTASSTGDAAALITGRPYRVTVGAIAAIALL